MTTVERNILHGLVVNDLAHAVGRRVDNSGFCRDLNGLHGFANLELDVLRDRGSDGKNEPGDGRP